MAKVDELNRLTNKSQLDQERLHAMERDTVRIQGEITDSEQKLEAERQSEAELAAQQEELSKGLAAEEQNLQQKIQSYNEVTAEMLKLSDHIEDLRSDLFERHSRAASKRSEAGSMESYRESMQKRKAQLLAEDAEINENTRQQQESRQKDLTAKTEAETALRELKTAAQEAHSKIRGLTQEIAEASKELDDLRIRGSQLSARKKTMEEMEHNYEGYNGAVRFIMKAGISGIEGVVGDLMKAPAGFETALETALGGAMQNIVCQKDDHAKQAIRLLKTNKAGRLTFLPMESVKGAQSSVPDGVRRHAGYKGMGCELAVFDPKYQGIFRYLLGRVAIVDHMDSAVALSKIAGNGIRFVTLDGEVINAGGAITGGKYKNASANLLARKSEIDELAKQVEALREQYENGNRQNRKRQEQQEKLTMQLQQTEEERRKKELEISALDAKLEAQSDSAHSAEESKRKRENELSSIEQEYAKMETAIAGILQEAERAEAQTAELEQQIAEELKQLEAVKLRTEQANEAITKARIARQEKESKFGAGQELLDRVRSAAEDFEQQITDRRKMLEDMEREQHKILFSSGNGQELFEQCSREKAELEDYIARLSTQKNALTVSLNAKTDEQASMGEKLNAYQDQKYQQEIKLAKNETQLDTLKEKLWDEFEISYAQAMTLKKEDFVMSTATKESREVKNRIRELGDVNVGAIREYEQVSERYRFLTEQRTDILNAMQELQTIIADMDRTIKTKFKENFDQVVIHFEAIFKELFGGGQAELRLDDENNPLEAGIEIIAQPPGKKLQNINLMSGGEKTMTAIALMFAVLKTKPTPFCILDEVEAALDDANIDRFANYLKNFHEIQFAVVTHQKVTMEHADVLYGVTMPEQGISKVISLRLGDDFEL